ncbi:hypothetical protein N9137_01135, partial [Pseudomonadales bacterium]|nr:hypothetical protein [Pseudomonadales bacterium]
MIGCTEWSLHSGCGDLFRLEFEDEHFYITGSAGLGFPTVRKTIQEARSRDGDILKSRSLASRDITLTHIACSCDKCGYQDVIDNLYSRLEGCGNLCGDGNRCINTNGLNQPFEICLDRGIDTGLGSCVLSRTHCNSDGEWISRCIDVDFDGAETIEIFRGQKTCLRHDLKFFAQHPLARSCKPVNLRLDGDDFVFTPKPCCFPILFSEGDFMSVCAELPYDGGAPSYPRIDL